jgi:hypothetical protein
VLLSLGGFVLKPSLFDLGVLGDLSCLSIFAFVWGFRIATTAANCTNRMAAVVSRKSVEVVSFQRMQPSHPPVKNVNSAPYSRKSACHFGGKFAQTVIFSAICAVSGFQLK